MATGASRIFYASPEWKRLRRACLDRDGWRCAAPGCPQRARFVDHIQRRPISATLTWADHLGNLRSLCPSHDAQVKELADGTRRRGGAFTIRGADADGWPLDPKRRERK